MCFGKDVPVPQIDEQFAAKFNFIIVSAIDALTWTSVRETIDGDTGFEPLYVLAEHPRALRARLDDSIMKYASGYIVAGFLRAVPGLCHTQLDCSSNKKAAHSGRSAMFILFV